jgi:ERF superfamily protein
VSAPEPTTVWELSPTFGKIFAALAKAQRDMKPAKKTGTAKTGKNGSREYKYATLDDVIDAIQGPLAAHGITRFQTNEDAGPLHVCVVTWLGFEDEYIRSRLRMPAEEGWDNETKQYYPPDTQHCGAALTYARRYALCAITGLATEDDDAARMERDVKPDNVRPISTASNAYAPSEQKAMRELEPAVRAATTPEEIEALRKEAIAAAPVDPANPRKRKPTPLYLAWCTSTFRAADIRIGSGS